MFSADMPVPTVGYYYSVARVLPFALQRPRLSSTLGKSGTSGMEAVRHASLDEPAQVVKLPNSKTVWMVQECARITLRVAA